MSFNIFYFRTEHDDREIKYDDAYQLKQEITYRVVVKGLNPTTPTEDIKAEPLEIDHSVRSGTNIKESLLMFYVDLDPNTTKKAIYEIKYINRTVIKIEPHRRKNDLVQCH